MLLKTLFFVVVFLAAAATMFVLLRLATAAGVRKRVAALAEAEEPTQPAPDARAAETLARWLGLLAAPSQPQADWTRSPLRTRFATAGIRTPAAPPLYFGAKTALTLLLPGALLLLLWIIGVEAKPLPLMAMALACATLGYYLPDAVLARLVARRQRELFEAFPDALDLMRVCVQAGLGLDAALERVGREMRLESPALADEIYLVGLELRAGASHADALHHLARRVGLEDVTALVAMLVESERFGTSVAEALRVHSESLRIRRRQRAEEIAARLPVKMLFPLVFCVFPALFVVLLGPAAVSIYRHLLPVLTGGGR